MKPTASLPAVLGGGAVPGAVFSWKWLEQGLFSPFPATIGPRKACMRRFFLGIARARLAPAIFLQKRPEQGLRAQFFAENAVNKACVSHFSPRTARTSLACAIPGSEGPDPTVRDSFRRHHIRTLALFGSVLRGDFGPGSDVDVLVEFEPDHIPGLIRFSGMELELSDLLGHKVDLKTPGTLSPYFRDDVMSEAQVQYVAA